MTLFWALSVLLVFLKTSECIMRDTWHVLEMREVHTRDILENTGVDWRIILKLIFKKLYGGGGSVSIVTSTRTGKRKNRSSIPNRELKPAAELIRSHI